VKKINKKETSTCLKQPKVHSDVCNFTFLYDAFIELHPHRLFDPIYSPKLSKILIALHFQKIKNGMATTHLSVFCKEI